MIHYDSHSKEYMEDYIRDVVYLQGNIFSFLDFFAGLVMAYFLFKPTISKSIAILIGSTILFTSIALIITAANSRLEAYKYLEFHHYHSNIISHIHKGFVSKSYIGTLLCYIISPPNTGAYINLTYAGTVFFISGTIELLRYFNEEIKPVNKEIDF